MNDDPNLEDSERGLYLKYRAIKHNDDPYSSGPDMSIKVGGLPAAEVTEPFFLLKFNDPYAQAALQAYATACEDQYPKLASDIRERLSNQALNELKDLLG